MKILMVHNRYLIRGGEDESTDAELALLRQGGHGVDLLEETNERVAELGVLRTAVRTIWARDAYSRVRAAIARQGYDLVHVQNFFPLLSPAVHQAAKDAGAAVVQSLRNYRLLCAGGALYRDGRSCEDCVGRTIGWPAVLHACYRGSRTGSAVVAASAATHRMLGTWERCVDRYVTPSEFARGKLAEGGLPKARIAVKPNFVAPDPGAGTGAGGYAIYVGRLSPEKGIRTLLSAWRSVGATLPLRIVGEGPLAGEVQAAASAGHNVAWLGRLPLAETYGLIGAAAFLVSPSECYETFGRTVVEAYAKGTPVIAARIGAIAELVEEGRTGLLFEPGDAASLARSVVSFAGRPDLAVEMRGHARAIYLARFTGGANLAMLTRIYDDALAAAKAAARQTR